MWLWLCPKGRYNSRTKMDKVRCLASHWDKLKEVTCWLGVQEKDDVIFPRIKSVGNRTWGSGMSRATWITISCEKYKVCWKLISHLIIVCVCVHVCIRVCLIWVLGTQGVAVCRGNAASTMSLTHLLGQNGPCVSFLMDSYLVSRSESFLQSFLLLFLCQSTF